MHVAHVVKEASSSACPQTQHDVAEAHEDSLVWFSNSLLRHGDREHVIKSEPFWKYSWAMRFASLLRLFREINAVEIDAWVYAWHRIHEPPTQHAYFPTKPIQAPRLFLPLLLGVDPVHKTKLGLM